MAELHAAQTALTEADELKQARQDARDLALYRSWHAGLNQLELAEEAGVAIGTITAALKRVEVLLGDEYKRPPNRRGRTR